MHYLLTEHIPSIDQAFELYSCDIEPELDLITSCTAVVLYVPVDKNPQVILCKTFRGREHPWGRREIGESTVECIQRELEEEAGVTQIDSIQVIGARKYINSDPNAPIKHHLCVYLPIARGMQYVVTTSVLPRNYTAETDEISEVAILDLDDPIIDASYPSVRIFLDLAWEKINF